MESGWSSSQSLIILYRHTASLGETPLEGHCIHEPRNRSQGQGTVEPEGWYCCSLRELTALDGLCIPGARGDRNKCPREGGLVRSDPHILLMCGLYQAFYGSYLPIAADSPCLCLRRHLIKKVMLVLTGQLRLEVRLG